MTHKKRINFLSVVVLGLVAMACGNTNDPDLISKTLQQEGVEYKVSPKALSRLQLPEPGVDTSRTITLVDYPEQGIFELVIGPQEVPAGANHIWYPAMVAAFPFDSWVQGFDWEITDSEKNIIGTDILHHVNIIDPNKRDLFYPIARRLFASSNDTPGGTMPEFMGVPIEKDAPLLVNVMFQNPTDSVLKNLYLRLFFPYDKGDGLINPMDVYPLYLDAGGPMLPRDFTVPPGNFAKGDTAQPVASGRILAAGSHLHNYGKAIKLVDVTSGDTLWSVEPEVKENGYVKSSPAEIFLPFGKKIYKDHEYAIVAIYDNPLDKSSPDTGMGTIGGLFVPSGDEDWAEPDYNNPLFIDDMVLMLGAPLVEVENWQQMTADKMRQELGIR